jgi:hypothetical protein
LRGTNRQSTAGTGQAEVVPSKVGSAHRDRENWRDTALVNYCRLTGGEREREREGERERERERERR